MDGSLSVRNQRPVPSTIITFEPLFTSRYNVSVDSSIVSSMVETTTVVLVNHGSIVFVHPVKIKSDHVVAVHQEAV